MKARFFLATVITVLAVCVAQAQTPTPAESPTPVKNRAAKKTQTTGSQAPAAASPASAASPAASPKAKRGAKKAAATAAASPTVSPSPGKFNLADLFKPKTSGATTSPAATPAAARNANAAAATRSPAPGGGHGLVWVNSETHVYHKEGSRFYGTTKKGKYMSEADANKEGNRAGAR